MNDKIPALKKAAPPPPGSPRGKRLLRLLVAIAAIVLVVLFFRSPLSEISDIQVSGAEHVTREQVVQALGVSPGDSFFFPTSGKLASRLERLEPIDSARIVKHFPGVLRVELQEYEQVAAKLSRDGRISAILANGLILPLPEGKWPDKPILTGWEENDPQLAELCRALSGLPGDLLADLSEIQPDPTVSYADRIKLYTRSKFEVTTTIGLLQEKIGYLSDIVQNREPGKIIMLEADSYLPYSAEIVTDEDSEADKLKEKDTTQ
ncbi:cell division protein FtsQ/DivIB [Paenibacillaceae bacterium WGS1546]|uniref:cell division protein FtsQ/DivIB n=1 Tax=Cohnella sp. WGS1546 TaxID=3366810 RepID=UPI00372CE98C